MTQDITSGLGDRVIAGLHGRLAENNALSRLYHRRNSGNLQESLESKKNRLVILDLNNPYHIELWNIIYNTPERFTVIEKKVSHQKDEYMLLLQFTEHGDNLPISKTREDFIDEYVKKTTHDTASRSN